MEAGLLDTVQLKLPVWVSSNTGADSVASGESVTNKYNMINYAMSLCSVSNIFLTFIVLYIQGVGKMFLYLTRKILKKYKIWFAKVMSHNNIICIYANQQKYIKINRKDCFKVKLFKTGMINTLTSQI